MAFKKLKQKKQKKRKTLNILNPKNNGAEDLQTFLPSRPYLLQFDKDAENHPETEALIQDIRRKRNQLVAQYGLTLPWFFIEYSEKLVKGEFRFCVHEVPHLKVSYHPSHFVVAADSDLLLEENAQIPGRKEWGEEEWVWIPENDRNTADIAPDSETSEEPENKTSIAYVVERLERLLFSTGPQFIGLQETKFLTVSIENEQSELAQELQRVLPLTRLSNVLQRLAAERVSIRTFRPIAEALIEHAQHERDPAILTDFVRIALRAQLCYQHGGDEGLKAWLLSPETEEVLRDAVRETQNGAFLALDSDASEILMKQLRSAFSAFVEPAPVLIVAQDLRRFYVLCSKRIFIMYRSFLFPSLCPQLK